MRLLTLFIVIDIPTLHKEPHCLAVLTQVQRGQMVPSVTALRTFWPGAHLNCRSSYMTVLGFTCLFPVA